VKKLEAYIEKLGLSSDPETLDLYRRYRDEVLRRNESINLTAVRDPDEFEEKHLVDSLSIFAVEAFRGAKRVLDVGTGAGLPGIPLAIAMPGTQFVLMDSVRKKLTQVEEMASLLSLDNVTVIHARAEEAASKPDYRESFDFVVSRAVANLSTLCEYTLPYVRQGGSFAAYKTRSAMDEIREAERAADVLGGGRMQVVEPFGAESGHILVCIEKIRPTPKGYPRKAGTPAKLPL
jgi:16S rRNA (guanine527-N7)-methyltransferase